MKRYKHSYCKDQHRENSNDVPNFNNKVTSGSERGKHIPKNNDTQNRRVAMSRKNNNVEDKSQDSKRIDDSTV